MRVQQLDLPAAFASLHSRPEGLTSAEAAGGMGALTVAIVGVIGVNGAAALLGLEEARKWLARRV